MNNVKGTNILNPFWVTGFCDAEGCFSIIISLKSKYKWKVTASFEINIHARDINILYKIKSYYKDVGNINNRKKRNICVYRVTSIKYLKEYIIPHFKNYPLLTEKESDFLLWSKVVEMMILKEHLNLNGFLKILELYASINRGVSKKVAHIWPNILPYGKIKVNLPKLLNPYYVSGFIAGDGSFVLGIRKKYVNNKAFGIYYNFNITQHSKDFELMKLFITFFNCGKTRIRSDKMRTRCDYWVQDLNSLKNLIIPHFEIYSLNNIKELDFLDFKTVIDMVYKKYHIIEKNQIIIKNIIKRMNNKRS
jgi:hypothetical protein